MTKISLIAAMAHDRVIGRDNDMPWHMPADLKHFKSVTLGKPVIMGRRTFDSIGRPLPGRQNIVVTSNKDWTYEGVDVVHSPEDALTLVEKVPEVMVIGGGKIYQHYLLLASTLYLTLIDLSVEGGDTQFPDWEAVGNWTEVEKQSLLPDEKNRYPYQFVTLVKD